MRQNKVVGTFVLMLVLVAAAVLWIGMNVDGDMNDELSQPVYRADVLEREVETFVAY